MSWRGRGGGGRGEEKRYKVGHKSSLFMMLGSIIVSMIPVVFTRLHCLRVLMKLFFPYFFLRCAPAVLQALNVMVWHGMT